MSKGKRINFGCRDDRTRHSFFITNGYCRNRGSAGASPSQKDERVKFRMWASLVKLRVLEARDRRFKSDHPDYMKCGVRNEI